MRYKWDAKEQFFRSYRSVQPVSKCELLPYGGHLCRFIFLLGLVPKSGKIPAMAPDDFAGLTLSAGRRPDCKKKKKKRANHWTHGTLLATWRPFSFAWGQFSSPLQTQVQKVEEINYTFVLGLSSFSVLHQVHFLRRILLKQSAVWIGALPATGICFLAATGRTWTLSPPPAHARVCAWWIMR